MLLNQVQTELIKQPDLRHLYVKIAPRGRVDRVQGAGAVGLGRERQESSWCLSPSTGPYPTKMGLLSSRGRAGPGSGNKAMPAAGEATVGTAGAGGLYKGRDRNPAQTGAQSLSLTLRDPTLHTLSQRSVLGGTPPEPRGPRERRSGRGLSLPAAAAATQYEDETRGHLTARS